MRKPLNILLVTTKLPYPPTDGGRIVVFETLRRLAGRGHHITLLCFGSGVDQGVAELERFCRLELVGHDTRTRWLPALLNLFSPVPYTISKYHSREMGERIGHLLTAEQFDLVHLDHLHMAHYASIARQHHVPLILRQHNVESLLTERFGQGMSTLQRVYARGQSRKMRRYEARACEQVDLCLAITAVDAQWLQQLNPRIKTAVVQAGVDLEYFKPMLNISEEPLAIVSVAAMDWLPNVDSVLWFCKQVFPQVRQELPQVRLYVVGKNPPPSVRELGRRENIVVTGFVEDVREYIAQGSVFIVPLRVGGGVRVRILQVMSMGKSVVSTSLGAEGIEVTDGQDIILADSATHFAQSIVRLLRDSDLRHRIGHNARKLVESCYSWDRTIDHTERIYQNVVRSHRGNDRQEDQR